MAAVTDDEKRFVEALGANIRRERTAKGMTQEQLAEFSELNIRTIQRIEAGELMIVVTTARKIRKALRCPWNRLLPDS